MKREWKIVFFILIGLVLLTCLYLLTIGPQPFLYQPTETYHFPPDMTQYPDRQIPQIHVEEEPSQERILQEASPNEGVIPVN